MPNQEFEASLPEEEDVFDFGPIEPYLHALAAERKLPVVALGVCTIRIKEAGPALRAVLARAADVDELSDDEMRLLFRGVHILGAARDQLACRDMLRLLRRPSGEIEGLLGDAITDTLARIIAGVFDGDVDALLAAISDNSVDEFVRDALLGAATFLTWEQRIGHEPMQRFLERFDDERLAPDDDYVWTGWIDAIGLLGLRDLAPRVEAAWRDGRVPKEAIEPQEFEADLAEAERSPDDIRRFQLSNLGYIEDIGTAMEGFGDWADEIYDLDSNPYVRDISEPYVNPLRGVGRNDPCPCGSGKKAKKCCLAG